MALSTGFCLYILQNTVHPFKWTYAGETAEELGGSPEKRLYNTNRNWTEEYKKIELDCQEGVQGQLECMKELCKDSDRYGKKVI